ncbi:MAG: hypothetical protein ACYCZZ_02795 [Minisyncoccota bacterium]
MTDSALGLSHLASLALPECVIDCDTNPYVPEHLEVKEHTRHGWWKWDPEKIVLWRTKEQEVCKRIEGDMVHKELATKPVFNANVLDHLLAYPHLIPEKWKAKTNGYVTYVLFWGTEYGFPQGGRCVRCLFWNGKNFDWGNFWLGDNWRPNYWAILHAS